MSTFDARAANRWLRTPSGRKPRPGNPFALFPAVGVGVLMVWASVAFAQGGEIVLASTADDGTKGNDGSIGTSLSADGTKVAFNSQATNLDPGDTDATEDVYVKDLCEDQRALRDVINVMIASLSS